MTWMAARFVGGLYDGLEQRVGSTPFFVAVGPCAICFTNRQGHRCKDLQFIGNPEDPDDMPPHWELYRLESVDGSRARATYVLPDLDLTPPGAQTTNVAASDTTTRSAT